MGTPVLPVFKDEDGTWVADDGEIRSSRDIVLVETLERFAAAPEKVLVAGQIQTLTVYRATEGQGYVKLEEIQPELVDED